MTRRLPIASLIIVLALAVGAHAAARDQQGSQTIATATTNDFRVVISATNLGGGGGAPTAAVTVRTFARADGAWRRRSERRLAGTYFWNTVTGPLAVCRLELRTTAAKARFRPRALVQLLRSPSLGCGPVTSHLLTG
jgi:hypothetical protein